VLGGIDLDPASCAIANEVVKAAWFFSAEDNGLIRDWRPRVWLNPPYGGEAGKFVKKLMGEMEAGRVHAAIVLVNSNATDAEWFQPLWDGLLCFTDHRVNFYGEGERSGSTNGSVFVYFGDRPKLFVERFSEFGTVVARVAA
jgi:ParB family chromosome partitioning protein